MKVLKRFAYVMAVLLLCAAVFAAPQQAFAAKEVTVFAAASMTESMNQIAELYKKVAPDVKIVYNFDSSGTLKTQIEQGADCDVFISAGQKQMNELDVKADEKANPKKADFLMEGTRFNIVANQVVMIVPKGVNPKDINDFKDVATDKVKLIALGNSDVPVGQYSEEIYKNLGLWEQINKESKITFASNVKEVLSQVAAGAVDCGIVYGTDAATSKAVDVVAKAPADSHKPIVYPAAIMKKAKDADAAKAFIAFLKGPEASAAFEAVGFVIPAK
ncbi:molybdate ABC transporter substrate-binding protein [Synergistaceae bacterium OttesenSCG-928-D05]|nr:molybdate ABC transporter substrate-binding protein [Synergistaceae bacterium OttesenSCG-928-D05]